MRAMHTKSAQFHVVSRESFDEEAPRDLGSFTHLLFLSGGSYLSYRKNFVDLFIVTRLLP